MSYGESKAHHPSLDKDAKHLYLKYKQKYINLKKIYGGDLRDDVIDKEAE